MDYLISLFGLLLFFCHLVAGCVPRRCEHLAAELAEELPGTLINSTSFVAYGTNLTIPVTHPTCGRPFSKVVHYDFCRVQLSHVTGPRGQVDLEVWLPSNWTGRFLSVGNGGLAGCINYSDIDFTAQRGFAVVGTDNGHTGNTASPLRNNPDALEDYAYRAAHLGVKLGKQVARVFYGKQHSKSYWLGCSTGGRQGFVQAQRFPEDFDGIIAGAPALDLVSLLAWSGNFFNITGPLEASTFLTPDLWDIVLKDVLAQCDHLDGYRDGVIEDPDLCQYRPERLVCSPNHTAACLTPPQVRTVRDVFSPLYNSQGKLVYPRMTPGSDATPLYWTGSLFTYPLEWWRYVVKDDATWTGPLTLLDIDEALNMDNFGLKTWDGDLSRAKRHQTKILHYHGLADAVISSEQSDRYYNHVSQTMGYRVEDLDEFYRYFRIPGLAHCDGGDGASFIGSRPENLAGEDPDGNVLWAMVRWVEEGIAPNTLLGTAYKDPSTKLDVAFQRRHCKFPLRNVYNGQGDRNSADSWICQEYGGPLFS